MVSPKIKFDPALANAIAKAVRADTETLRKNLQNGFTIGGAEWYLESACSPQDTTGHCSSAPTDIEDACKTNATVSVCKRATHAMVKLFCSKNEDACSYLTFVFDLWNFLLGAGGGSLVIALLLTLIFFFIYRRKIKKIRKAGGVSGVTNGTVSQDGTSGGTGTTGTGVTGNGGTTGTTQNINNQPMTMNRY